MSVTYLSNKDGQTDRQKHKEQFLNKIGNSSSSLQYNDRRVIYLQIG